MRYILVPGACHGGWWYEDAVRALEAAGHHAQGVTLAGLAPDGRPAPAANLDTHVAQVLDLLSGSPEPAILVGHSYGGSVITGVADRRPYEVAALVYLDAFVPQHGDSCWSMTNDEQREWYGSASGTTGLGVEPMPFFDGRTRPHPLGSLMQRSRLNGAYLSVAKKIYVFAAAEGWLLQSPFIATADRLRTDSDWTVLDWDIGHNVLRDGPEDLVQVLTELA